MAGITFAAKLSDDRSLTIPQEAVEKLGIHPGDEIQLNIKTSKAVGEKSQSMMLGRALDVMTHRSPEQIAKAQARAMRDYQPKRTVPAGKTLSDVVSAQWPGNETD